MESIELDRLVSFRMTELEAREELNIHLKDVFDKKLWRDLGHRSFSIFCEEELGFERSEIRDTLIRFNAIVTSEMLVSKDHVTQKRIDNLRNWRRTTAQRLGVAAFRVIPNTTLLEVAKGCPKTADELQQVRGIGPSKLKEFGADILSVIN